MRISFPTRPGRTESGAGLPARAEACRCVHGSFVVERAETCVLCGRYEDVTIAETWRRRARAITDKSSRLAAAA